MNACAHPTHHAKRQLDCYTHFHTTTQQSPHWLQWYAANSSPNCPFPFNDHHQNLIHPYWARPTHHPKRHPDPISRFATIHMCGQTNGTDECSITWALRSTESDVLKSQTVVHSLASMLETIACCRTELTLILPMPRGPLCDMTSSTNRK